MTRARDDRYLQKHVALMERIARGREQRSEVSDADLILRGLSIDAVSERVNLGLANTSPDASSRSLATILRSNIFTLFNAVVGGSFIALLVLGQWKDALFGFAVVSNVVIGIVQEYTSKRTLDRVAILNQPRARVLRAGSESELDIRAVVLDDALILRAGDQIPADATLLDCTGFSVDESLLTGESDPVDKLSGDSVLSGSIVVAGFGLARTTRVGIESYSNAITREARRFSLVNSELRNALARIIRWISWALIPLMLIALNGQMQAAGGWTYAFETGEWLHALVASVASIISMIPQGLVLITSISFALAAVKLSRQHVLVQELPAVEGLARVDVVCFDKTGTLTDGAIVFDAFIPTSEAQSSKSWREALAAIANAADANSTAKALASTFTSEEVISRPRQVVPFDSRRKWSATVVGGRTWVFGAPEMILSPSIPEHRQILLDCGAYAELGARVLLLATYSRELTPDTTTLDGSGVTSVGMVTMREQVRDDAAPTIAYLLEQGIQLKVISGDSPKTVSAVAQVSGIPNAGNPIDGRELPEDLTELGLLLETHNVFGRVSPEQKKQMVLALRERGHVVAMTGDGVNDALALKSADMGIAMGNGSAATKAVSRIVLLTSAFASLPSVLGEGRRVIANVERVSRLFLTKTTWAMLLAITFGLLLWPFPFLPRQLSGVDGYTIGIAAFLLALLPNNRLYRPGFLKRSLAYCIPSGIVIGVVVTVTDAILRQSGLVSPASAQTVASIILSLSGLWVLGALSRPLSGWRLAIVCSMYAMFVGMFWIPLTREFFGYAVLPTELTAIAIGAGAVASLLLEVVNFAVRRILARSTTL